MPAYETLLKPHRLPLDADRGPISAGLSPRVFFSAPASEKKKFDLVTFTSPGYIMGGAYLWQRAGTLHHPETGSPVPYFREGVPLPFDTLYPFYGRPELGVDYAPGRFVIYQRAGSDRPNFHEHEELSEKYGIGLFESKVGSVHSSKMEIRDFIGEGLPDVILGENNWEDYWPRAELNGKLVPTHWSDANYRPFDDHGRWRGGRLHGRIFFLQNLGEDPSNPASYKFAPPRALDGIDQYGFCAPIFGNFTGDGQIDIIAGNFLHDLTFFKGLGPKKDAIPQFAQGIPILNQKGLPRKMMGVINYLAGGDLTGHGRVDLVIGSENGYITLLENLGELSPNGSPTFASDYILLQEHPPVKADVLAVPTLTNSQKGSLQIVVGTAGGFFYSFEGIDRPRFLRILNEIPRILPPDPARGSIQGPSEIGWGYVAPTLFDWDGGGHPDLVFSDINGDHHVCINYAKDKKGKSRGSTCAPPVFNTPLKLTVDSTGQSLQTVWRARPTLFRDPKGEVHYVCLDEKAKLAHYIKTGPWSLAKRELVHTPAGQEITFTDKHGGTQGRVRMQLFDWDQRGILDLLVGLPGPHNFRQIPGNEKASYFPHATNAILRNRGTWDSLIFDVPEYLTFKQTGTPLSFGHHACTPTAFEQDNTVKLVVGAEDGQIYLFQREEFN